MPKKFKVLNILPKWWPYLAMQIWKYTLVKKGRTLNKIQLRHEMIHYHQQKELFIIFFFIIYVVEFAIKLLLHQNWDNAYRDISFEREAYKYENNGSYLNNRKKFAWMDFLV